MATKSNNVTAHSLIMNVQTSLLSECYYLRLLLVSSMSTSTVIEAHQKALNDTSITAF